MLAASVLCAGSIRNELFFKDAAAFEASVGHVAQHSHRLDAGRFTSNWLNRESRDI